MIGPDKNELMEIFGNAYHSLGDYQKVIEYHEKI